jgi:hypothetical protein
MQERANMRVLLTNLKMEVLKRRLYAKSISNGEAK